MEHDRANLDQLKAKGFAIPAELDLLGAAPHAARDSGSMAEATGKLIRVLISHGRIDDQPVNQMDQRA
jgi:hypothetical protein